MAVSSLSSSWMLLRGVLAGSHGRIDAVVKAVQQLSLERGCGHRGDGRDGDTQDAFMALTAELCLLAFEDSVSGPYRAEKLDALGPESGSGRNSTEAEAVAADENGVAAAAACAPYDAIPEKPANGPGGDAADDGRGGSRGSIREIAGEVLRLLLLHDATTHAWASGPLMCQAVAERVYPLRPDIACSWALSYVQQRFGGGDSIDAAAAGRHAHHPRRHLQHLQRGQQQRQQDAAPQAHVQATAAAAPHLLVVLGLPLLLSTAGEMLQAHAADAAARATGAGTGHGAVPAAAGADPDLGAAPIAQLLAAVAALSGEASDAVWGVLGRALDSALGAPLQGDAGASGGGGAAWDGEHWRPGAHSRAQHHLLGAGGGQAAGAGVSPADVRLAAMVLAAAEVVVDGSCCAAAAAAVEEAGGVLGEESNAAAGGDGATASAQAAVACGRLESLLKPQLQDPSPARRSAIVRAVQIHVPYATSTATLTSYERLLQAARASASAAAAAAKVGPAAAAAVGGGGGAGARGQEVEQVDLALVTVRSRRQHLEGAQGHVGGGAGTAAVAAAGASGDVRFAGECLAEFGRLREDHVKKMAGQLYKAGWQQRVKPVLLRPTLDAAAARRVHEYLLACASFRLVTVMELDRWEQLQARLGVQLDDGSGGAARAPERAADPAAFRPVVGLLHKLAEVGPQLGDNVLAEIMARLSEAMAEELRTAADDDDDGGAAAAAAELVEMILRAFVAAEELSATAAGAAAGVQSHLGWQLALLDAVARMPALHAPLGRRLLRLATDPSACAALDEGQVLGLAAALACASAVRVHDGGGGVEARYAWRLPPPGAAAVPGPALAEAALRALPLGPSPVHVRFSATLLVAYLRHCAALGRWVLYESAVPPEDVGAAGAVQRRWDRSVSASGFMLDAPTWPEPYPVSVSALVAAAGDGCEGAAGAAAAPRRRRRQAADAAGCVPACALHTLMWVERCAAAFGATPESCQAQAPSRRRAESGGNGEDCGGDEDDGDAACWRDVARVCRAFRSSPLGAAMMAELAGATRTPAGDTELGRRPGGKGGAEGGAVAQGWDEAVATRLSERALRQGLGMPRRLLREQAALLARCIAPVPAPAPVPAEQRVQPWRRRSGEAGGGAPGQGQGRHGVMEVEEEEEGWGSDAAGAADGAQAQPKRMRAG